MKLLNKYKKNKIKLNQILQKILLFNYNYNNNNNKLIQNAKLNKLNKNYLIN